MTDRVVYRSGHPDVLAHWDRTELTRQGFTVAQIAERLETRESALRKAVERSRAAVKAS